MAKWALCATALLPILVHAQASVQRPRPLTTIPSRTRFTVEIGEIIRRPPTDAHPAARAFVSTLDAVKRYADVVAHRAQSQRERVRALRGEALSALSRVLEQYERDPHLPDAAPLLAGVLLFDQAEDLLGDGFSAQTRDTSTAQSEADSARAQARFRETLRRAPKAPLTVIARYLLALSLSQQKSEEARRLLLGLVCANQAQDYGRCRPDPSASAHVAEIWFRIGDLHFDDRQFRLAEAAYQRVLPDVLFGAVARYKLAWSRFNEDRYSSAIAEFERLLAGEGGGLHVEALEMLSLCFIEQPRSVERLEQRYRGRRGAGFVPDVYRRVGDALFDAERQADATRVYELIAKRWPDRVDATLRERLEASAAKP